MTTPRPGGPVRGSRSGRPIMAILDLLGRRWALRVGWELRDGALSFNELQQRCDGMSPSVLSQRLREGLEAGTCMREDGRYRLSADGERLIEVLQPLEVWAQRWARRLEDRERRSGGPRRRARNA